MSKKDEQIRQLQYDVAVLEETLNSLEVEYSDLQNDYFRAVSANTTAVVTVPGALPKAGLVETVKDLFKYERFWTVSFELNPFKWFSKPRYYRFNWRKTNSKTREGQADFGPFSVNWYRDRK